MYYQLMMTRLEDFMLFISDLKHFNHFVGWRSPQCYDNSSANDWLRSHQSSLYSTSRHFQFLMMNLSEVFSFGHDHYVWQVSPGDSSGTAQTRQLCPAFALYTADTSENISEIFLLIFQDYNLRHILLVALTAEEVSLITLEDL